jgi:hypothetical protein
MTLGNIPGNNLQNSFERGASKPAASNLPGHTRVSIFFTGSDPRHPSIVPRPVGGTATNLGLSSIALINLSRTVAFLPAAACDRGDGTGSDGS